MHMLARQLCLLGSVLLSACATHSPAQRQPSQLNLIGVHFKAAAGDSVAADSGSLLVRENRQHDSRIVSVAVVRLRSTRDQAGVPTIYVSGGSGAGISAMRGARFPFFAALRDLGDVIAFDMRGTGRSAPALTCNARLPVNVSEPLTREALVRGTRAVNALCADSLRSRGFDLSGYNSREVVEDIEELRRALGADRIRIIGTSTGTHLALEYLRKYPQRVVAAFMLGTEGPGQTEHLPSGGDTAFSAFSELMRRGSQAAATSSLVQQAQRVFAALDARPVVVGKVATSGGASVDVAFGGYDARVFVASTLGDRRQLAQLPQVLGAMAAGRFEPLAQLKIQALQHPFQSPWESLHDCQAGSSAGRRAAVRREARTALLGYATLDFAEACDGWGVSELPDVYRSPVSSDVATLFVSATLDGRTPVANAEEVRMRFRNSAHLILDGGSHGDDLFIATPAILRAILEFPGNAMRGVTRVPVD